MYAHDTILLIGICRLEWDRCITACAGGRGDSEIRRIRRAQIDVCRGGARGVRANSDCVNSDRSVKVVCSRGLEKHEALFA